MSERFPQTGGPNGVVETSITPRQVKIVSLDSQAFRVRHQDTQEEGFAILCTVELDDKRGEPIYAILAMPDHVAHQMMHATAGDRIPE
jgi:hypothetical protein